MITFFGLLFGLYFLLCILGQCWFEVSNMSSIILGILIIIVCFLVIGISHILPALLIGVIVGSIIGLVVHCAVMIRYEIGVVETQIIKVEPIIKQQAQNTGYSVGYGYYEHYEYADVKVGDEITFRVKWNDGYTNTITCKKGNSTYKRLYKKLRWYEVFL